MEESLVTLTSFTSTHEAELARGLLESHGIAAVVLDRHTVSMNWTLSNAIGGVRLQVPTSALEEAKRIISAEYPSGGHEDEGWGSCVSCGSTQINLLLDKRVTMWTWVLLGIPLLRPRRRFRCRNCGLEMQHTKSAP